MPNVHTSRRSGLVLRGGANRRATVWLGAPMVSTTLAANNTVVLLLSLNAAALALRPFTIVRTRGNWLLNSDQEVASERFGAALGIAVVSDQATAIGISALPTPITDASSDMFLLYEAWVGHATFDVTAVVSMSTNEQPRSIDSKAMRKVNDGQDIVTVIESSSINEGSVSWYQQRMLIKLH